MSDLLSLLGYEFFQRALLAGALLGLVSGLLSPWIVLRGLSFSVDGLAHASLGGLALGFCCLGTSSTPTAGTYLMALALTCAAAVAIGWFSRRNRLSSDTAVGACCVAAFALGMLLLALRRRYVGHLESYLFGNLLAVSSLDCQLLGGLLTVVGAAGWGCWRWLWQWTFDEELAQASGVPVAALRYGVLVGIASTVVLSVKIVGILLVTAILILPGATASLCGRTPRAIMGLSVAFALFSLVSGLCLSNQVDAPPGPTIVLLAFALFAAAYTLRSSRDRRRATV